MNNVQWVVLAYCLAVVAYDAATGKSEFVKFKSLTETADRQRFYLRWFTKSALLFLVGGVVGLALMRRLQGLLDFPHEFAPAHAAITRLFPHSQISPQFLLGVGGGIFLGAASAAIATRLLRRGKKKTTAKTVVVGDIAALIPRNAAEIRLGALLSVNAGLSEEIFFRLLLPLTLVGLFGHPILCFLVAAALFGMLHVYQGPAGFIAASLLGLVLTAIYVATGSLGTVIFLHTLIDLNGLVLRPGIALLAKNRKRRHDVPGDLPNQA